MGTAGQTLKVFLFPPPAKPLLSKTFIDTDYLNAEEQRNVDSARS